MTFSSRSFFSFSQVSLVFKFKKSSPDLKMNSSTISKCLLANANDLPKTLSLLSVLAKPNDNNDTMEEYTLNETASSCDCSACENEGLLFTALAANQ